VWRKIIRVAPAAATGCYREKLVKARLNESSSAGLISLPVKCSLKIWVPQILPLCFAGFHKLSPSKKICWKDDKKSYCVLRLNFEIQIEVRVMGVSLFRLFPGIARFLKQSQFDS
jgi:hypothetical protein